MFNVVLYKISKNENSTKQPTASDTQITLSCRVLDASSIISPTITITAPNNDVREYNYAYIEEFKRYYWINDIIYDANIWTLKLTCDVLATYKNEIGGTSLYVLRSANASNGYILDNYYQPTTDCIGGGMEFINETYFGYGEAYILNIMGSSEGTSTLYQLTPEGFMRFIKELYTTINDYGVFDDVIKKVVQFFGGNPVNLINSMFWVPSAFEPFPPADMGDEVVVGSWRSGIEGKKLSRSRYQIFDAMPYLAIPKHPKASTRGAYLNVAPYSQYYINWAGCGTFPLDATKMVDTQYIGAQVYVEARTCEMSVRIFDASGGFTLADVKGLYGVPMNVNASSNGGSILGSVVGTIGKVGTAVATGGTSLAIGAGVAGIGSAITAIEGMPTSSQTGNAGIVLSPSYLQPYFYDIMNEDNARNGRPLCAVRTPASLGGFMIVQRGDVEIDGTFEEMKTIKQFLEGGFYYE